MKMNYFMRIGDTDIVDCKIKILSIKPIKMKIIYKQALI